MYDFLLLSNTSNYISNSHRLQVIVSQKIFSHLLSLGPTF